MQAVFQWSSVEVGRETVGHHINEYKAGNPDLIEQFFVGGSLILFFRQVYRKVGDIMDGREQFNHLAKGDGRLIEGNVYLFSGEIHEGVFDPPVQEMQFFQEPDAGGAMDDRDEEFHFGDASFGKGNQFIPDLFLIQEGIFIPQCSGFHPDPGIILQLVIVVKFVLVQELVYCKASLAAKEHFVPYDRVFTAIGPAMHTFIVFILYHG